MSATASNKTLKWHLDQLSCHWWQHSVELNWYVGQLSCRWWQHSVELNWFVTVWNESKYNKALFFFAKGLFHGLGGESPICHHGGLISIPGRSVWNLWWEKWLWALLSPSAMVFLCCHIIQPMLCAHSSPMLYDLSNEQHLNFMKFRETKTEFTCGMYRLVRTVT